MKVSGTKVLRKRLPKVFFDMICQVYTQKKIDGILTSYLRGRKSSFRINTINGDRNKIFQEIRDKNVKINQLSNITNIFLYR